MANYTDEQKVNDLATQFLAACNNPDALKVTWLMNIKGLREGNPPVITRATFQSQEDCFCCLEKKFLHWWDNTYLKMDNPKFDSISVDLYTNLTPTEVCSPLLNKWLEGNENVTNLTIYFSFVYTWLEERRKVPEIEYIRRLQELSKSPNGTVRIVKVDENILADFSKDFGVSFPGYKPQSYPNEHFERDIITA